MTGLLLIAGVGLLLAGCRDATPRQWQYKSFQYRDEARDDVDRKICWITTVYVEGELNRETWRRPVLATNQCSTVGEVFNVISKYGWEFVGFDGTNHIIRRPENPSNDVFITISHRR